MNKRTRKARLRKVFGFNCTCPACVDNSDPVYSTGIIKCKELYDIMTMHDLNLNTFNAKRIRKEYDFFIRLLKLKAANYPCIEQSIIQEYAKDFLAHISRPNHVFV